MSANMPNFSKFLTEAYKFAALQANKKPLSENERQKVLAAKATFNRGKNGQPSSAIWKSQDSQGNTVYVANTHRAFAVSKTLEGAIRKFHSEIKDTA
jgi:hypothetical protein